MRRIFYLRTAPRIKSVEEHMKKFVATLLALISALTLAFSLTACNKSPQPHEPEKPAELTKEQFKKAIDNTVYAENFTFALEPDNPSVNNEIRIDAKTKSLSFNDTDNSYFVITEEGDDLKYKTNSAEILSQCEAFLNKSIKTFAELSYAYVCMTTHLDMIKEMEFTYNAEDNSYFVNITEGVSCKLYFEGNNDNAKVSKFITNPDSEYNTEWIFTNYGTTQTIIPQ